MITLSDPLIPKKMGAISFLYCLLHCSVAHANDVNATLLGLLPAPIQREELHFFRRGHFFILHVQ